MRPAEAEAARRQLERDRLVPRVEQDQERVVAERLAVRSRRGQLLAVQEDTERVRVAARPVALAHLAPVGPEPPDVRQPGPRLGPAEEVTAVKDRMLPPELDQPLHER